MGKMGRPKVVDERAVPFTIMLYPKMKKRLEMIADYYGGNVGPLIRGAVQTLIEDEFSDEKFKKYVEENF